MTIRRPDKSRKIEIDLDGPDGNAYFLLGTAARLTEELHLKGADAIMNDMMSSDYEHLVEVFDEHFGDYVDLISSVYPCCEEDD